MKKIPQTLNDALLYWVDKTPAKTFISSTKNGRAGKKNFTFQETKKIAENLSVFITAYKPATGDKKTICLLLPRTPELIFSFLAASITNLIPAPINYLENENTIKEIISSLIPAVIIIDETVVTKEIQQFVSKYDALVITINNRSTLNNAFTWEEAVQHSLLPPNKKPFSPMPNDLVYLNFTTGTSGFPKGALCSHANLYWNTRSVSETFQLTEHDVHLCMFASFAHPHELFCRALYTGASLVLMTEISPKAIVKAINTYNITCMMGLAVMYKMMAEHCSTTPLPSLRIVESGGMFTSPEIQASFFSAFQTPILSVWGSTETTGVALANSLKSYRTDGSMGTVSPHYQVKVVDQDGKEVATDEIGELIFSSQAVVAGYLNKVSFPAAESWYYSGDLARKDKDGFFYFVERKTGMIKVAGLKVYPLQVELVIQEHPAIKEVAVIGIKEKRRGFVPKAYIVTEAGMSVNIDDLKNFCKKKLAPYMIPKSIQQLAELPKIGSGKVNKKALLTDE